jgi:hypothetical protein
MSGRDHAPERFDDIPALAELRDRLITHFEATPEQPHKERLLRAHRWRPLALMAVLVLGGTTAALAAAGVFQTGTPVGADVPPAQPNAFDGAVIPGSVHLLSLRVADPDGGPPWGLQMLKTTRGLECVRLGRMFNGEIGVLGEDGAFSDDGRFHPFAKSLFDLGFNCGTMDARGNAFVNEAITALPASALTGGYSPGVTGGCVQPPARGYKHTPPICSPSQLRDVYFGLLGPDATTVTHDTPSGSIITTPTTGADGAYLIVLNYKGGQADETGGPSVTDLGNATAAGIGVIRAVSYTGGRGCNLAARAKREARADAPWRKALLARFPAWAKASADTERAISEGRAIPKADIAIERAIIRNPAYRAFVRTHQDLIPKAVRLPAPTCPPVGYVAVKTAPITSAEVATPISVRTETAKSYCRNPTTEIARPCGATVPTGFRRVPMRPEHAQMLVIVTWRTRVAITNQDSHYEVYTDSTDTNRKVCGDGVGFGPTESDFKAGQLVTYTTWIPLDCPGVSHGRVVFVADTAGPGGSMPVPAQPGEGPDIPVGKFRVVVP